MRGVTKATAFSFQSAITSANAEGAGSARPSPAPCEDWLAFCVLLLFVERWRPRMTAARGARNCVSPQVFPVHIGSIRSAGTLTQRRPASRVALMRLADALIQSQICTVPRNEHELSVCRGLGVAIGKGYKRKTRPH